MGGGCSSASVLFVFRSAPIEIKANNPSLPSIWTSAVRQSTIPDAQTAPRGGITSDGIDGIVPFREEGVLLVRDAQERVGGVCANTVDSPQSLFGEKHLAWSVTSLSASFELGAGVGTTHQRDEWFRLGRYTSRC